MAAFSYECLNKQGQVIKGELNAESVNLAVERLRNMGLSIIDLSEYKPKTKSSFLSNEKPVKVGDLTIFSRQLSSMLSAGIPVTRAITTLSRQSESPTLRKALESIARNIEGGMNLTDAFSAYPKIFNGLYISMLKAGEMGGMLEVTLLRLSEQLQKEKQLKDDIKSATAYPKMIGIFAIVIFIAMLIFMVPIFKGFIPQNVPVPGPTQVIFNLSDSVKTKWYFWLMGLAVVIGGIIAFLKSKTGHDLWENTKLKMPIFGKLILKTVIARFTRTLATLLEGGIPVVQALQSAGPTSGSDIVANTVSLATRRIEEGKSLASTLEESGVFPPMVTHMMAVGEESGSLPSLLDKVAEFYEQEVSTQTKGLQALIQPVALVLIAVVVGGMLISLYLPIFTAVTSTGGG